ncbi:MAG: hypothetical protein V4529_17450 [Gemmatimonadota bacterium]
MNDLEYLDTTFEFSSVGAVRQESHPAEDKHQTNAEDADFDWWTLQVDAAQTQDQLENFIGSERARKGWLAFDEQQRAEAKAKIDAAVKLRMETADWLRQGEAESRQFKFDQEREKDRLRMLRSQAELEAKKAPYRAQLEVLRGKRAFHNLSGKEALELEALERWLHG